MPLQLSTPQQVQATVDQYRITSFSVDLETQEVHVAYDRIASSTGQVVSEGMLTISGPDFQASIGEADAALASVPANTPKVYGAIKASLYQRIMQAEGVSGSIV